MLAGTACLGLMVLPGAARAQGPVIHANFCGVAGWPLPLDQGRRPGLPDCPSPCHATCPRKQTGVGGGYNYTG